MIKSILLVELQNSTCEVIASGANSEMEAKLASLEKSGDLPSGAKSLQVWCYSGGKRKHRRVKAQPKKAAKKAAKKASK
jgi:hypothetical protein